MPRVGTSGHDVEMRVRDDNAGEVDFPHGAVAFGPGDFQGMAPVQRQPISAKYCALLTDPVKSKDYLSAIKDGTTGKTGIIYFFRRRPKAREMMAAILARNDLNPKLLSRSKLSFRDQCVAASLLEKGLVSAEGLKAFIEDKRVSLDEVISAGGEQVARLNLLSSDDENILKTYRPAGKRVAELLGQVRWRVQAAKLTRNLREIGSREADAALEDVGRADGYLPLAREILGEVSGCLQGNDLVNFVGAVGGFSLALVDEVDRQRYVGACCRLVRDLAGVEAGGYEGLKRLYALLYGREDEKSLMLRYVVAKNLRKEDRGEVTGEGRMPEPVPGISFGQSFYLLFCALGEWFRESRAEKIPTDVEFLTYWLTPVGASKAEAARIRKEVEETAEGERKGAIMEILAGRG